MKVERYEDETDEEWAQRLAEEIEIANNTEISQYFVEQYTQAEDMVIINYIKKDSWTWREHPEGPFKADQIIEWKNKAELLPLYKKQFKHMTEHALELEDKLKTIKTLTEPFIEWGGPSNRNYRVRLHKHPELQKYVSDLMELLVGSQFTTNSEKEVSE